jgi:hypothetical protein
MRRMHVEHGSAMSRTRGKPTVTITGLEASNRQFQNVKLLQMRFPRNPIDFEG